MEFFEKRGHKIAPSSSLLPTDPSVLFTTAGMQQFKPYYLGQKSPYGKNTASCQKCFRTSDIDQVGDESHVTFLEMLGNFSFGGYFKTEAIKLSYDFIFKELKLSLDGAVFTIFEGDKSVPEDKESKEIWRKLGVPENKIKKCGRVDNFWGPTGKEGPCGPTTEIHINGTEIWNLVFNEYYQSEEGKLTPLKQKGVDTGMGLERLAMAVHQKSSVYETDLFSSLIVDTKSRAERIVADHIKAAVFLISEGILPSNVERGYILRRILRRAIRYGKILNLPSKVIEIYQDVYPEIKRKENDIITAIKNEEEKFEKTLEQGLKEFNKGADPFILFTTYGFPVELTRELAKERGKVIDMEKFNDDFKKHQELSRTASAGMFKGGLADAGEQAVKYHTATHLLLAALRQILGSEVFQRGSNITSERLRFDFSYSKKMTPEEIKKTEDLVNQKINENLEVKCEEMTLDEAKKQGAMGVFESKYGERVKVYSVGDFSKEICGGPHVQKAGDLGYFKIIKEESSSAGTRRIKAVLE